jgi:hypothetical protein
MALQVLNMSTNVIDFERLPGNNNLIAINDYNSVIEYISEGILGYQNAFPEYEQGAHKSTEFHKSVSIKLYKPSLFQIEWKAPVVPITYLAPLNDNRLFDFSAEINPPPPKEIA